jgi:hypothetical protein
VGKGRDLKRGRGEVRGKEVRLERDLEKVFEKRTGVKSEATIHLETKYEYYATQRCVYLIVDSTKKL